MYSPVSYRLPAEVIRDNALAVSGLLVRQLGGAGTHPYQPAGYYKHLNFPLRVYKADGSRVATLSGHNGPVFCIAFDPNGKAIATAGMEGEVRLFEFPSGKLIKAFVPVPVLAKK